MSEENCGICKKMTTAESYWAPMRMNVCDDCYDDVIEKLFNGDYTVKDDYCMRSTTG